MKVAHYSPAEHLEGVLEGGLRLGGDVPLDVVLHGDAAEGDGEDAGHVEDLGVEVGHVGLQAIMNVMNVNK